jgi:fatty-acyl-CoA synthase
MIYKSQIQLDPAYQPAQILHALTKVEAKALICAEEFKSNNYYQMVLTLIPELNDSPARGIEISSSKLPSLKSLIFMSNKQYRSVNIINSLCV